MAQPGLLHLVPRPERAAGSRADYRGMGAMFFGPSLPFEAMMDRLMALEGHIKALAD